MLKESNLFASQALYCQKKSYSNFNGTKSIFKIQNFLFKKEEERKTIIQTGHRLQVFKFDPIIMAKTNIFWLLSLLTIFQHCERAQ